MGVFFIVMAFALSLGPDVTPSDVPHLDKILHTLAYAGLTFWFVQLYPKRWHLALAAGLISMGILIEVLQYFESYHSAEVKDALANAIGVAGGWISTKTPLGQILPMVDQFIARRDVPEN